jgi:hypothetical protein
MTISHVQSRQSGGSGTSLALAFTSDVTSGSLLVAAVANETSFAAFSDDKSNSWSADTQTFAGGPLQLSCGYAPNAASGATTITADFGSTSQNGIGLVIGEYSGVALSSPRRSTATGGVSTGTSVTTGNVTATAEDMLLGFVGYGYNSKTVTEGSSFTLRQQSANAFRNAALQERLIASGGSYSAPATLSSSGDWFARASLFIPLQPAWEQTHYRFRNDDGSETTATWAAAEDADLTAEASTAKRLRVQIDSSDVDPAGQQMCLEWRADAATQSLVAYLQPADWRKLETAGGSSVAFGTSGTVGSGGTTSITAAYPASIARGDLLVCQIASRPQGATITTPSGWTALSNNSAQGTGGSEAADAGSARSTILVKEADGTESGSLSITLANSPNAAFARIHRYTKTTGKVWQLACANGSHTSGSTSWSVTAGSDPGVTAGDMIFVASAVNSDAATYSAQALSQTGITFGAANERQDSGITTGNDLRMVASDHVVSSGTSSAAPVYTMTASTGSPEGASVFLRIRQVDAPFQLSASGNITASGENTTAQLSAPASGSFAAGRLQDDENPADLVDLALNEYSEWEWSITSSANVTTDDVYQFRVTRNGTALETYTETPQWIVGSSGSFQYTGSGGFTVAGTAPLEKGKVFTPTGGVSLGGTAPLNKGKVFAPSGGVTFGGAATTSKGTAYAYSSSGGLLLAGEAAVEKGKVFTPTGGVAFAGAAASEKGKVFTPSGGVAFGGEAATEFTSGGNSYEYVGSGGIALAGQATTSLETMPPTGGDAGDGPAWQFWKSSRVLVRPRRPDTPSPVPSPRSYVFQGQGGPAWGGAAATELVSVPPPPPPPAPRSYVYRGSGPWHGLAGAAVTRLVDPYAAARREEEAWLLASTWGQPMQIALLDAECPRS